MNEQRFVVSDVLWQRLKSHLLGKVSDAGAPAKDNRLFLEAVLWQGIRERIRDRRAAVTRRCQNSPFTVQMRLIQYSRNDQRVICHARRNNSTCLLYTSPSPRDRQKSRMPSSA